MDGNLFFTDEEYDIFAKELQDKRNHYIESVRKGIQEKIIKLSKEINNELVKLNLHLYTHKNPQNITSLIIPTFYNKGKVDWVGVRFGKSPKAIEEINKAFNPYKKNAWEIKDDDDKQPYAFQKHSCMQLNITYNGVEIGIFHAVPNGAIDRAYLHEHIDKNDAEMINAIKKEIANLIGYGFEWHIWDINLEGIENPEKIYKFDNENEEDFLEWYSKNDRQGCYSSMLVHFPRYDERINADNIVNTTIKIFSQLYNFYKLTSWDIEKKIKKENNYGII